MEHRQPALIRLCLLLGCVALAAPLSATADSTSELLRQQERQRQLQLQLEQRPEVRLQTLPPGMEPLARDETPCFAIHRITLNGKQAEGFRWALAAADPEADPATGSCLGARAIAQVLQRVQNAIIAQGFITTRVLAEPQDLSTGSLELALVPGRVESLKRERSDPAAPSLATTLPTRPGDLLNLRDLEQGLENLRRLPGAETNIDIAPGANPGGSELRVHWSQPQPLRASLTLDDAGSRATGRYRTTLGLDYDNPLRLGDRFHASIGRALPWDGIDTSHGSRDTTLHYDLPWGYWLLGLTHSRFRYHQCIAGINQVYIYSGRSQTSELKLSRVVHRDAVSRTRLDLSASLLESRNFIDDTEILVQRRRMSRFSTGLNHHRYLGAATLDLGYHFTRGSGAFDALPAPEESSGEGTARPRISRLNLALDWPIRLAGQSLAYRGELRAQYAHRRLIPQDRFAIGGRYSVRGFDGEQQLSADHGAYWRNELALTLPSHQQLYLGLDLGLVAGGGSSLLAGRQLAGASIGWRGRYRNLGYELFLGHPLQQPQGFGQGWNGGFQLTLTVPDN